MDADAKSVAGNEEVQEEGGGVRNGPGEFEVRVKDVVEVDELFKLLVGARGGADTVINVAEEEVGDGASVALEEGLFHVSYKEAGIAWAHTSAHSHPSGLQEVEGVKGKIVEGEDKFCQANERPLPTYICRFSDALRQCQKFQIMGSSCLLFTINVQSLFMSIPHQG
eukprot:g47656.t1